MTLIVYSKYYRWENHYKFPHFAGKKTEARMPFNFLHETGRLHPCSFVFADLKCFPVGSSPVCHCCLIRCPFCQSLGLFCHRKRIKDLFLALRKQPLYNLWSFELMQAPCQLLIDLYSILGCDLVFTQLWQGMTRGIIGYLVRFYFSSSKNHIVVRASSYWEVLVVEPRVCYVAS